MDKERYRRGSHTVTDLQYHFVWKTKYGYGILRGDVGKRVREMIRDICASKEMKIIRGNVRSNHIHLLISAPPYLSPSKMAPYLKGKSSYQLQREFGELRKRFWGASLVGPGIFLCHGGSGDRGTDQELY